MRILKTSLFLFVIFLAQTVVFSRISIFGANLDMLLVVVIIWGLLQGPLEGLLIGLICGLFVDIFSFSACVSVLSMAVVGLGAGFLKERVFKDEQLVMFVCVFTLSIAAYLIDAWILFYFCQKELSNFWPIVFLSACINTLLAPVVRAAVYKLNDYEERF